MAAAPQEYSVLCRVSGMLNKARFKVPMEALTLMLELMPASVELSAGFDWATACPRDPLTNKKQIISNKKTFFMVVTGF